MTKVSKSPPAARRAQTQRTKKAKQKSKSSRLKSRMGTQLEQDRKRLSGKKLHRKGTSFSGKQRNTGSWVKSRKEAEDSTKRRGARGGKVEVDKGWRTKHSHLDDEKRRAVHHKNVGGKQGRTPKSPSKISRYVKAFTKAALNRLSLVLSLIPTGPNSPIGRLLRSKGPQEA